MTENDTAQHAPKPVPERIAKVMARAGIASRREAERMIVEGRVSVNGEKIISPALDVLPTDKVRVDGKPLDAPQETRLWLYYKPVGLVTSTSDEKGRQTVFDALPRDLPRVMTVGRLDLNSEGLLLLTNDGELKRRLELPTTGWLRRYRVRVNGQPNDLTFAPLRRGVTIDGEEFQPMEISLDSQQGANAWLTVGIREGRNREIRRAMSHVGLIVNRLIRIGYGPFKLTGLEANEVREIKRKVLRDQLGGLLTGEDSDKPRSFRERGAARPDEAEGRRGGSGERRDGKHEGRSFARNADGERKPFERREDGGRKPFGKRDEDGRKPFARRGGDERRPFARREDSEGGAFGRDGARKPHDSAKGKPKSFRPRDRAGNGDDAASRGGKPGFKGGERGGFKPRADKDRPRAEGKPGRAGGAGKPAGRGGAERSGKGRAPDKGARPQGKGPRRG